MLFRSLLSRAVSGVDDEKTIFNAYVFIFESNGDKVYSKFYNELNKVSTITINDIKQILGGSNMTVAVIANVNNIIFSTLSSELDAVTNKNELLNKITSIKEEVIERGTSFLMSGINESVSLINPTNSINIPLSRVDAKIRFDIKTNPNSDYLISFLPLEWRVVSVPKKARIFPNDNITNEFAINSDDFINNYFTSEWQNFESLSGRPNDVKGTFAFYEIGRAHV